MWVSTKQQGKITVSENMRVKIGFKKRSLLRYYFALMFDDFLSMSLIERSILAFTFSFHLG